ncbi:protein MKS1-like [Abrus precatorius]|uniref:Protein MKS1-like n=1 Tax=Abrus precatorius TaxID=3816 RepID=A0A8B8JZQ3_ABRPR|nr:protein MKS1-like [Abrus precatorius]
MNSPEFPAGGTPPSKKELQIQGPRPPPLKVSKVSHKIKKPPLPPPPPIAHHHAPPEQQQREPVIIYSVSPKVIHVTPGDFMDVVQRLTGASSDEPSAGRGDLSPAARLASIEKTSPSEKERERVFQSGDDDMMLMLGEGVEMGQFPGILSPEPGTLPPIPPEVFSPVSEAQTVSYLNDFWSASSFMASPSGFLSVAVVSPQPSPNLFSLFDY